MTSHHLHLVSDATGETVNSVARACLVQFRDVEPVEHNWSLVRTAGHMDKVLRSISANPGVVLYTIINPDLRRQLVEGCRAKAIPTISVLDPVMRALGSHFGTEMRGKPGLQHELDAEYFSRIEAMNYTMSHDDGQLVHELEDADIILTGVSRTSKTPTCIYLANRGIRAANVPLVPGVAPPAELLEAKHPFVIGLTKDPARLVQVRKNRLRMMTDSNDETDYTDIDQVREEVAHARKLCTKHGWHVIDVTKRSIEETAAAILNRYHRHLEERDNG